MAKKINLKDPKALRKSSGKNQSSFWGEIGVTQSGGSRYEAGRNMPKPVQKLLRLKYEQDIKVEAV